MDFARDWDATRSFLTEQGYRSAVIGGVERAGLGGKWRQETPSWLLLPPEALDAILPADALDRRPATSRGATPFELPAYGFSMLDSVGSKQ